MAEAWYYGGYRAAKAWLYGMVMLTVGWLECGAMVDLERLEHGSAGCNPYHIMVKVQCYSRCRVVEAQLYRV